MTIRHENISQRVTPVGYSPLLKNEDPYFNNINRGSKNAYDYADNINTILSYGGCVSRMRSVHTIEPFSLYTIVCILEGEVIKKAANTDPSYGRYGIVVAEKNEDGYYIVCTFCPNFVFSGGSIPFLTQELTNYDIVHNSSMHVTMNSGVLGLEITVEEMGHIGSFPLAKVTGNSSIFFCGTYRLWPETPVG